MIRAFRDFPWRSTAKICLEDEKVDIAIDSVIGGLFCIWEGTAADFSNFSECPMWKLR